MKRNSFILLVVVLGILFPAISSQALYNVPTNGLIGYWPGNGNANDNSPLANNGSFNGAYAPGVAGQAFSLNGAANAYVYISAITNYLFKPYYSGWSVGFWFSDNGTPINAGNGIFVGQDNGSGYNPKWFVEYGYSVYGNGPYYYLHVNDYNQERIFAHSIVQPAPTGWHQLTVTVNNTTGLVVFYLDGQFIGTDSLGPNYVIRPTAPLLFGRAEGFSFKGLLSDVVLYDYELSTNEVVQLAFVPPVSITSQPKNASVSTGGTAAFSVGTVGLPPLAFQWALNGTNIVGATNATLTVSNITAANVGNYNVTINNSRGSVTSSIAVLTTVDPVIMAGLSINGVVGTNYVIQTKGALAGTNWIMLTNFSLPTTPYLYVDYGSITNRSRFYEVFAPNVN